jgi:uncharacterized protein (UPF0333 family)
MHACRNKPISKGQIAVEYMIMFGMQFLIVALLWVYITEESQRSDFAVQTAYAKNAINKITDTANLVSVQGPPAQTQVTLVFPDNINRIIMSGPTLIFEIKFKDIMSNLSATSFANITGNLTSRQGTHRITIKSVSNYVEITEV